VRLPAEFLSESEPETLRLAGEFARGLLPGDIVALEGDLGAGKTVFVRGMAEGLGADPDSVTSPTFALVHEYPCPAPVGRFVHLDLYRLDPAERELEELGLPQILDGAVAAVEWPRRIPTRLLPITHRVGISREPDHRRRIRLGVS
jgi:tRNA threonylcarbamoyladenosine biosynthesis protein TsaE